MPACTLTQFFSISFTLAAELVSIVGMVTRDWQSTHILVNVVTWLLFDIDAVRSEAHFWNAPRTSVSAELVIRLISVRELQSEHKLYNEVAAGTIIGGSHRNLVHAMNICLTSVAD